VWGRAATRDDKMRMRNDDENDEDGEMGSA
jgi:hypothetical protein